MYSFLVPLLLETVTKIQNQGMINGGTSKRKFIYLYKYQNSPKKGQTRHINRYVINIDFRYQSIEIEKKVVTSINIDDFPIEIDNHFLLITIDVYRFC